jgi:membrane fusion protein (multidrug efflux system)
LQPNEAVIVSSEIAGRIERLRFTEGEEVEAGDVLVELDSTILRAELAKIQSDLTLAEANRERAMTLAQRGAGTLRARDEAIAAHQAAVANVALAQARLDKASITAPFSGIVGLRAVSAGAYVTPGDRLVGLADIDPIKVDFRVPELVLSSVRTGQAIRVTVDAVPGRTFEGRIYAIDPTVDVNGRAVRLRARVPNPDRVLFPGLFARVQIVVERRENAVLVPESAVFSRGQERLVYRVVDGRAVLTRVELGQRRPGQVEVIAGLGHEAVVVTAGQQQVRDGARVEIAEASAEL